MRRFRPGTLMLLFVIGAVVVALLMERNRSARPDEPLPRYTLDKVLMRVFKKRVAKFEGGRRPADFLAPKSGEEDGR